MDRQMNSIKVTQADLATFAAHGPAYGDRTNVTGGARQIVAAWRAAGMPELPADPCPRGACQLRPLVSRWDADTLAAFVAAGAGKGASAGARRLAEWMRGREQEQEAGNDKV